MRRYMRVVRVAAARAESPDVDADAVGGDAPVGDPGGPVLPEAFWWGGRRHRVREVLLHWSEPIAPRRRAAGPGAVRRLGDDRWQVWRVLAGPADGDCVVADLAWSAQREHWVVLGLVD